MRVVKPQPALLHFAPTQIGERPQLGVSVGLGFRLSDPRALVHEASVWTALSQAPASVPLHELALPKRHAEWLLLGHAVAHAETLGLSAAAARDGESLDWTASVAVGRQRKEVSCSARLQAGLAWLPLDHVESCADPARAASTPAAMGKSTPQARLLLLAPLGAQAVPSAAMGPLDQRWSERQRYSPTLLRTARGATQDGAHMGWPAGTDLRLFQQAYPDQWAREAAWPASSPYELQGMGPKGQGMRGRLPGLEPQLRVHRRGEATSGLALQLQTLWFLPDADIGVMWWHGAVPLQHLLDDSVQLLVVALNPLQEVRDGAALDATVARRLDLQSHDMLANSDFALMPDPGRGWAWETIDGHSQHPASGRALPGHAAMAKALDRQWQSLRTVHEALERAQAPSPGRPFPSPQLPPHASSHARLAGPNWRARFGGSGEPRNVEHTVIVDEDLSGIDISDWSFKNLRFERCRFAGASLQRCKLDNVSFIDCDLDDLELLELEWNTGLIERCRVKGGTWSNSQLAGVHARALTAEQWQVNGGHWEQASLTDSQFKASQWTDLSTEGLVLQRVTSEPQGLGWSRLRTLGLALLECALPGLTVQSCHLEKTSAVASQLTGSRWQRSRLLSFAAAKGSDLSRSVWTDCELDKTCWLESVAREIVVEHCAMPGFNAEGLDASGSRWLHVNLHGAHLMNAQLVGARLKHSALREAILYGADLQDSEAEDCNFIRANLAWIREPARGAWRHNLDGRAIRHPRRNKA